VSQFACGTRILQRDFTGGSIREALIPEVDFGTKQCIHSDAMPLSSEQQSELLETMHSSLQESSSKLSAIYTPQWNVRNEISRTLLTISSAILVISISLSSRITAHRWIVGFCWAAFLFAILAAVASLWLSLGLYTLPAFIVGARKHLRERVELFDVANSRKPRLSSTICSVTAWITWKSWTVGPSKLPKLACYVSSLD
jgi:hypothetical protein